MRTALVVVDVQTSLMDRGPWQAEELVAQVTGLVDAARAAGAPVVLLTDRRVQPDPSLHSSLVPQPSDVLVEKGYCDAFLETPLDAELKARGVDRLIVCGIQTDFCVDTTCRSAASHGYEVLLVGNAHSTFDHEYLTAEQIVAHHNRVLRRLPAGRGSVAVIDAAEVAFA
ncbi:MAG: isochorismatase family protein [Rhodospirillaceae bacterium]|nr:isochorismatase family protein [Rhodospirillaceae bacterium]